MHRRTLPIADPCTAFRPEPGKSFCDKCEKHVHDLSAMTRREAERFLGAHVGERICVAYRSRKDGSILVKPEPRMIGVVLMALGLAACTGYAPEIQHPDDGCRDAHGYEIDCKMAGRSDVLVTPEVDPLADAEPHSQPESLPPPPPVEPVLAPEPVDGVATVPVLPEGSDDDLVGLVEVDPELEYREMGEISVDDDTIRRIEQDDRRSRREARREARRDRWASRHSGK